MEATSNIFPVFSQLHADSSEPNASAAETIERPRVVPFAKQPKRHASKKRRAWAARSAKGPGRSTKKREHEIALSYEQETRSDTRKAIHAVAYLLEWASESGNQPIDGVTANGLGFLLRKCASTVGRMFTIVDLRAAGGDPKELEGGRVRR
jgi:hypothetical protein